ncbi:hypothetical protein B0H14DRAFT_3159848 [Mycena olivaceomarginata]|nr:hypothetical protein B0H14DRAFT_3159848 [Mycena olivaceomarginata]
MVVVDVRGKTKESKTNHGVFHHVHATAFGTALHHVHATCAKEDADQTIGFRVPPLRNSPPLPHPTHTTRTPPPPATSPRVQQPLAYDARTSTRWRPGHPSSGLRTQTKLTSALGDPAQLTRLRSVWLHIIMEAAPPRLMLTLPASQYSQAAPLDLDTLRHQIAAEERTRIVREQEVEALRIQGAQHKAQKQACELEELRIREEHRAQLALCNFERSHTLTAQHAELQAHTQCALAPSFRVVRCPAHRSPYPEFHDSETLDLTPTFVGKHNHHHQAHGCGCKRKAHKVHFMHLKSMHDPNYKPSQQEETNSTAVTLEDIFSQLFGGAEAVSVEQLLQHICGGNTAAQPKTESKPAKEAPAQQVESPITIEQLISHFLGAAGIEVEQSKGLSSNATASTPTSTQPSEKNKTAPVPATSQSAPKPVVAPAPIPATAQALQPVGCEHIINHFLGATSAHPAAATQPNQAGVEVDLQQLLNMFLGSAVQTSAPTQPQAGPSNSVSASKPTETAPAANKTTLQEREECELTEAIRMSLAESQPQPSPITNENKGMAPAPAPVKDVASSTTEVQAINASFAALSSEFVFPTQLHFSTSRTASPTRNGTAEESVMANLSYSTQNQPLRFYHQALSGLLVRLDAVESFGDGANSLMPSYLPAYLARLRASTPRVERVGIALYPPEGRGLVLPSPSSPERELGGEGENEGREDTDPLLPALDAALVSFPVLRAVHVRVVPDYVVFSRKGLGKTAARFADLGSNLELPGARHGGGTPQGGTWTQRKQTQRPGPSAKRRGVRSCMRATWTSCARSGSRDRGRVGVEC